MLRSDLCDYSDAIYLLAAAQDIDVNYSASDSKSFKYDLFLMNWEVELDLS